MVSDVEMSLEDIITKKKKKMPVRRQQLRTNNGKFRQNSVQGRVAGPHVRPGDARNKIILKRRTQIADLRDKLADMSKNKDVRYKLEQMRLKKTGFRPSGLRNVGMKNIQENRRMQRNMATNIQRGFIDLSRQVTSGPLPAPPKFNIERHIGYNEPKISMRSDRIGAGLRTMPKPILRTVENDVYHPATPIVIDDDFDYAPLRPQQPAPRASAFNLKIIAHNDNAWNKGLTTRSNDKREERLPPSILKKRPMAALRMDRERRSPPPPAPPAQPSPARLEYRIVVSNLRSSVTGTDIQELFGDVGGLVESRLVRPGTAEVIYSSLEDAQRAVELYHNRQLDGQPMNCLLVNPQSVVASGRLGASKGSLQSAAAGGSSVVPDIDTFHKVLFSSRR